MSRNVSSAATGMASTPPPTKTSKKVGGPGQRTKIVQKWKKIKAPTAKCRLCQSSLQEGSYECEACRTRICSECVDAESERSVTHKAVAADYINEGCWQCGFLSGFNPAFKDMMPLPALPKKAAKSSTTSRKRKRALPPSPDEDLTPAPSEPSADGDSPDSRPERPAVGKEASADTLPGTRPTRNKTKPQKYLVPPSPDSLEADQETSPPAKRAKTAKSNGKPSDLLEAELETTPPSKKAKTSKRDGKRPMPPAEQAPATSNTVIIGAGVTGLFIALELAEKAFTSREKCNITVLDINDRPSSLASGHCAGFIYSSGLEEQWPPLLETAYPLWDEFVADSNFRKATGFHAKVLSLALDKKSSSSKKEHISWIRDDVPFSYDRDDTVNGRLDPAKLAEWLYTCCGKMEVKFHFNVRPTGTERDKTGSITGVRTRSSNGFRAHSTPFPCSNLVIAAGPFSPGIFKELFPERNLALENHAQIWQSIQIQGVEIPAASNVGLTLALPNDSHFHGPAKMTARGSKNKIDISRCYKAVPDYTLTHEDALRTRVGRSEELRYLAAEALDLPGVDLKGKSNISAQRVSLVSTGNVQNPVIGKVPSWAIGRKRNSKRGEDASDGVWLAYGFGNYGTTLAPAVGRFVAQMIRGEETEVDLYDFAVTELETSDSHDVPDAMPSLTQRGGKDKGRALW